LIGRCLSFGNRGTRSKEDGAAELAGGEFHASSPFSRSLVDLMAKRLSCVSSAYRLLYDHSPILPAPPATSYAGSDDIPPLPSIDIKDAATAVSVYEGVLCLSKSACGMTHPHVPITLEHTVSLWVYRPYSETIDKPLRDGVDALSIGDNVMRGKDWSFDDCDGGLGCIGTVVAKTGSDAMNTTCYKVLWSVTAKQGTYKFFASGVNEIVPACRNTAGLLYSMGAPAALVMEGVQKRV
jgi:hypothetical protein